MAIAEAEPKKGEGEETSTGASESSGYASKTSPPNPDSSNQHGLYFLSIGTDFRFSMPEAWSFNDIQIFLQCCHENKEHLKNFYCDEKQMWEKIAVAGREKSGSSAFNVNNCIEIAKCLKQYIAKNEKRMMDNENFKLLHSEVVNLLPYFGGSDHVRRRSRSRSLDKRESDVTIESCRPEVIYELMAIACEKHADQINKKGEIASVWKKIERELTAKCGVSLDVSAYAELMKKKIIQELNEIDPTEQAAAFKEKTKGILPFFDYMRPTEVTSALYLTEDAHGRNCKRSSDTETEQPIKRRRGRTKNPNNQKKEKPVPEVEDQVNLPEPQVPPVENQSNLMPTSDVESDSEAMKEQLPPKKQLRTYSRKGLTAEEPIGDETELENLEEMLESAENESELVNGTAENSISQESADSVVEPENPPDAVDDAPTVEPKKRRRRRKRRFTDLAMRPRSARLLAITNERPEPRDSSGEDTAEERGSITSFDSCDIIDKSKKTCVVMLTKINHVGMSAVDNSGKSRAVARKSTTSEAPVKRRGRPPKKKNSPQPSQEPPDPRPVRRPELKSWQLRHFAERKVDGPQNSVSPRSVPQMSRFSKPTRVPDMDAQPGPSHAYRFNDTCEIDANSVNSLNKLNHPPNSNRFRALDRRSQSIPSFLPNAPPPEPNLLSRMDMSTTPTWFLKFVEDYRRYETWKMQQMRMFHQELLEKEYKKISLVEDILAFHKKH